MNVSCGKRVKKGKFQVEEEELVCLRRGEGRGVNQEIQERGKAPVFVFMTRALKPRTEDRKDSSIIKTTIAGK